MPGTMRCGTDRACRALYEFRGLKGYAGVGDAGNVREDDAVGGCRVPEMTKHVLGIEQREHG